MAKVVIGGTFECLHDGHRKLLNKAFELADGQAVDIGLTSNEMANKRERHVPDYSIRKEKLQNYLKTISEKDLSFNIIQLDEPYGKTLEEDYDFIVVSPETYPVALKINSIRKENGKREINIVEVGFVLDEDEKPISSTRIIGGVIDIHGHLRP
ncbi:phosphopantetheine adenylyltransferase [Methanolobus sp. ZRKC3]|uniref:phosphopantetheine adenylyltransferase n=1 Tax=Methanolobus sp. ZRKC3 TaxID=3125786 RepID=UPI0032439439